MELSFQVLDVWFCPKPLDILLHVSEFMVIFNGADLI